MLSSAQIRGARAMLGWSQEELSIRAQIARSTINRLELEDDAIGRAAVSTMMGIKRALEGGGVVFTSGGIELKASPSIAP